MAAEPVNGWAAKALIASESVFGTVPNPANSQAIEFVTLSTGPNALGQIRPIRDRNPYGRGMTHGYVEGRQAAIDWSLETSIKSGAEGVTPKEHSIYLAAGLYHNAGVYSQTPYPIEVATFASLSIYRLLGTPGATVGAAFEAEQLRGGVVRTLSWSGGDKELTLVAAGQAIDKRHLGYAPSITINNSDTTFTFANAEEGARFGVGWYQCESEAIAITAMDYTTYTATILRAQLSTSAASHSSKPLVPYFPSAPSYSGVPISEATASTVTLDGQAIRCLSWSIEMATGMELLPGETGSKYVQGVRELRSSVTVKLRLIMKREDVALLGKSTSKKSVACTIVQGAAQYSVNTFSMPYCEIDAFQVPDTANDVVTIDVTLRTRDSATGNDAFTLTKT